MANCKRSPSANLPVEDLQSVHSFDSSGIQFAVDGVIALSAVTAITGDAGAGKTTLVTSLAGHVAVGEPFLGRNCSARRVLICDRENTLPVVQERFRRLGIQDGSELRIWGS